MTDTPTKPLNAYPMWGESTRANPHPLYAQLRREAPVWMGIGPVTGNHFWFVTRYDDCVAALKDPRIGKEIGKHLTPEQVAKYTANSPGFDILERQMLNVDPPDHTRLRALVHKAFTPRMVEDLRLRVQQIADDLIDAMLAQGAHGEIDLIRDYAFPLPITVICELLGVPARDREQFRDWTRRVLFINTPQDTMAAGMEFAGYLHEQIDRRIAEPTDDLISALVRAESEGDTLDRAELMSMIFLLLAAGHETTVNLIGNGMLSLLQHLDQMALLKTRPELIRSAIEEMLRFNGPVEIATTRWAFENIELGGVTIPKGDVVMVALMSANRDEAVFSDPDRFDIMREPNKHIAFGNGIHYCVGAPLARLEGAIAINTLLRRLPDLRVDPDVIPTLKWNNSMLLHGVSTLPLLY